MASLVWKSTNSGDDMTVVVLAGTQYSFANGVPTDVPNDLVAAMTTALNALADTGSTTAGVAEV